MTSTDTFHNWLNSLTLIEGFPAASKARPYAHNEEQYDNYYGTDGIQLAAGRGLCNLLKIAGIDTSGPALEIGCGSGRLSAGLAAYYSGPAFLATDSSPAFLRITKRKLESSISGSKQPKFALLNGGDLNLIPRSCFSLITLRSTLHHILDYKSFIADCGVRLKTGGALILSAEPCESGYVLMGAIAQSFIPVLEGSGVQLTQTWRQQIQIFTDTMKFYCRQDLDKSMAEDKHLFREIELQNLGEVNSMSLRFFPNATLEDFENGEPDKPSHSSFRTFILMYIEKCMGFDPALVRLIEQHLKPNFDYIDECYSGHVGPILTGVFIFQKK